MAEWDTAYINNLPDSAFAVILPGGTKDSEGKTTPRSLRKLPHHNAAGAVDMAHLRNALSREPQADMSSAMHAKASRHLEAHMSSRSPMKAQQVTGSKWRILAIPFGGPFHGKDFDGEYFDAETDVKPHWFKARPVIFHHGGDRIAKDEDYGEEELDGAPEPDGWWATAWLNRSARYWAEVDKLLRAGKMYGSSGSIGHLVRKDHRTGHIEVWPHVEQTLTLTPSNPFARITASKALAGFDSAGIAVDDTIKSIIADLDAAADDLRADLPEPGEPSGDLGDGGEDVATKRTRSIERIERLLIATRTIR